MKSILLLACLALSPTATSSRRNPPPSSSLNELTERLFFRLTGLKQLQGQSMSAASLAPDGFLDPSMISGLEASQSNVSSLVRYFQVHKPVNPQFLDHPLLQFLVKTVATAIDDSQLWQNERTAILVGLFKVDVFRCHPSKVDEGTRYLLGHYFGRRVLAMVGPVLEQSQFAWLVAVNSDLLTLNHELLSSLKDFSWLPVEQIEQISRSRFDLTTSDDAMKTMTTEGLLTFLRIRSFQLNYQQAQAIADRATNFKNMLIANPAAIQAFANWNHLSRAFGNLSDVYYQVLAPVLAKTDSPLDMETRNALVAFYQLTEGAIDSFMDQLASVGPDPSLLSALKDIFMMRRQMLIDCDTAQEEELVALLRVPLSYPIAAALNEFDDTAGTELVYERPKNQTEVITVYCKILEHLKAHLPYCLKTGCLTSVELVDLWLEALKKPQNTCYQRSNWNKKFIFDLLAEQLRLGVDDILEGDHGDRFLDELQQMPSRLFTPQDLDFLAQFPEKFQILKNKYAANPIAFLVDLPSFEVALNYWLGQRSELISSLQSSNNDEFLKLSKIEALIESMIKSIVVEMSDYDLICSVQSCPVFVAALNEVPQVLNSRLVKDLLDFEEGISFLKANPRILYNLTSYWDFDLFLFADPSRFADFDIESVGIGLNTFSVVTLNYLLDSKFWRLDEPVAFLWRLKPSLLMNEQLKNLTLTNLSAQAWSSDVDEAKRLHWHLKGVDLIGNVTQPSLTDLLNWKLTCELRFLDIFFNDHHPMIFSSILAAEASATVLIDEFLKRKLQSATAPHERAFLNRVRGLMLMPLSEVRASVILSVNKQRTAPERFIAPFRVLQPKFGSSFEVFLKSSQRTGHVAQKVVEARKNFLALATEFNLVDSVMCEQIELLGLLSLSLESFNPGEESTERKLYSLTTGTLPRWQKRIVAKIGNQMRSSINPKEIE